jgi:competence protein ComFC
MLKEIISLFYPQICAGCRKPVHKSHWAICLNCRIKMPRTRFQVFDENPVLRLLEGKCDVIHAFAFYYFKADNTVQDLMHALKYKGVIKVGEEFGQIVGQHLSRNKRYKAIDYVIPLPLHISKQRLRGFNQCDSIAQSIALKLNTKLDNNLVKRITSNESQTTKTHFERHENVDKIFKIKNPKIFENKSVLLIDDVITTGSTLSSLAAEFNAIPNCRVYVGTIAIATND